MSRWMFAVAIGLVVMFPEQPLAAAGDLTSALLACAAETDDARRLRCFDATVAGLRDAKAKGPTPAATPAAAPAPATAATAPTAAAAAAPTAVVAATPPAAAAPAAPTPAPSPEEKFGLRADPKKDKLGELSELAANVTAISAKPRGELVITLDNGQVWAEIAPGSKIRLKPGDPVRIEAGTLGSFILIAPNKRSSKVSRVR